MSEFFCPQLDCHVPNYCLWMEALVSTPDPWCFHTLHPGLSGLQIIAAEKKRKRVNKVTLSLPLHPATTTIKYCSHLLKPQQLVAHQSRILIVCNLLHYNCRKTLFTFTKAQQLISGLPIQYPNSLQPATTAVKYCSHLL